MRDTHRKPVTGKDVISITGPLEDDRVAAILGTGATAEEVMEAFTWLASDDPLGPDPDHRVESTVARVYDILSEGRFEDEDEDAPSPPE